MTNHNNEKNDLDLQGFWKPDSAIMAGQALPEVVLEGMSLEISGDQYTVLAAGMTDKGYLVIDQSHQPNRMRIIGTAGPNTNKELTAIYKIEGENLVICYDLTGQTYPLLFESKQDTQSYLVSYSLRVP